MRFFLAAVVCCVAFASGAFAASPDLEKQFVDTYRKAYEAKDAKTLNSLLYTKGADPQALEFYKMMMTGDGGKVTSIELLALTAEDKARSESGKGPDGRPLKLVLPATRKLVMKTEVKDKNGSAKSSSELFVGESDGRLYVLVPAAAK